MKAHTSGYRLQLIVIAAGLLISIGCDRSPVASKESDWCRQNPVGDTNLYDVWGTAFDNVFAVGASGVIIHFDGTRWSRMNSGTASDLYAVYGRSPVDVFAAGRSGQVLHYDGISWISLSNASLGTIHDMWTSPGQALYVCGASGEWFHDGNQWNYLQGGVVAQAMQGFVGRVHPALPGNVLQLIVVSGSAVSLWTQDAWDYEHWPVNRTVSDLWGLSSGNIFAVCRYGYVFFTKDGVLRQERPTSTHLNGVYGRSSKCVYAVGSGGKIVHYDGDSWSLLPSDVTEALAGVWVSPAGEVFIVGYQGVVLSYSP